MGNKLIGRRKLSRQFVIMIITIQAVVVLLFCIYPQDQEDSNKTYNSYSECSSRIY